jgi:hypothetical protein
MPGSRYVSAHNENDLADRMLSLNRDLWPGGLFERVCEASGSEGSTSSIWRTSGPPKGG